MNTPFRRASNVTVVDIDTSNTQVKDAALPKSHDLVCLMNMLEHVNCPEEVLRAALGHCRSSADVLIEVPLERFMHNVSCFSSYESKKVWTEHINCFSSMGAMSLAKNVGLEPYCLQPAVIEISALGKNPADEDSISNAFTL